MPNLNISFTPASPTPANGYRVRYWNVNTPGTIITVSPNPASSPVSITGVAEGCYAGTVESACGSGQFSSTVSFSACSPSPTYYYYALNEYACSTCTLGSTNKVGRSTSVLSTSSGTHYKVGSNTYVVTNEITPAPGSFDVNLDTATQTGATCSQACNPTPPSNGTISISNFGGSGATLNDFTPAWFFLDTGNLPLQNLQTATGTHSGFIGNFGVTVTGAMGGCLTLTANGTMVQNLGISASGIYTFLNVSIPPNATVSITLDQGACQ